MPAISRFIGLALLAVVCAACVKSNSVPLIYALGPDKAGCVGELVIRPFSDDRGKASLGVDADGEDIVKSGDAADWVGWALFDELTAAGCQPKYRTMATDVGDLPTVTGQLLELHLNQTGTTTYSASVSVRLEVSRAGETLHVEKLSSQVEDVVLPGYSSRREILAEALRGLMNEAVPSVANALNRK